MLGKLESLLPVFEQASYVEKGLDPHVGRLLSSAEIPRVDVAILVAILMMRRERQRLEVEMKLHQKDALLREVTRRYMRPRKLWHPRGISGTGFLHL